jgi:hypothetical protein
MTEQNTKRLNLSLKPSVFDQLQEVAEQRGTSIVDVIRSCIRVGLMVHTASNDADTKIIVRKADQEQQVFLL